MAFLKHFFFPYLKQTKMYSQKYAPHLQSLYALQRAVLKSRATHEKLLSKPNVSEEEWKELQKEVLANTYVKPAGLDTFVIRTCQTDNFMHTGTQYYKYLEKYKKPSILATAEYLQLYEYKNDSLSDAEKEHIYKLYKEIREEYPVLNSTIASSCIIALAKLENTDECIKIINHYEEHDNFEGFLIKGYDALIVSFLKQNKMDLMYEYLIHCCKRYTGPSCKVYAHYLKYCLKDSQNFSARIQKLFSIWAEYGIIPHERTVLKFIDTCNEHGWSAKITSLRSNTCQRCKLILHQSNLTEEEVQLLKKEILKKLFRSETNATFCQGERNNFLRFMKTQKSYDVVIDALNVLYAKIASNKLKYIDNLLQLIRHLRLQNKRVLVIGRSHMTSYKKLLNIKNVNLYFVDNTSSDDVFILFATIASGKDTILISNDFMRQHKFLLNDAKISCLFKRWQHFHQYTYFYQNNKINLTPLSGSYMDPEHYINGLVQKTGSYWHVPFRTNVPDGTVKWNAHTAQNWSCFRIPT